MASTTVRRELTLRGQVQGVGCRPWIWREATRRGLSGWVQNTPDGVRVSLIGPAQQVDDLVRALWEMPPPARVTHMDDAEVGPDKDLPQAGTPFEIRPSVTGTTAQRPQALWGPDLGVCPSCLAELCNPASRRWRHPFIHCPQCGPRYTLTRTLPFDRAHTSMAGFGLCPACQSEYSTPTDRRYHDQTQCCPQCGPQLQLWDRQGTPQSGDVIADTLARLLSGQIVAVKGVGGFHLCCDARQSDAVARLRALKRRRTQPLAVMVANPASAQQWAHLSGDEVRWLTSAERPIVLVPQNDAAKQHLPGVAPHLAWLGVMLPYTPLHHLLFHEAAGRPEGTAWLDQAHPLTLVMTSGNAAGEPLVISDDEAWQQLAPMADALLMHDRPILARNDDSVMRVRPDGSTCWLRRGRGWAPLPTPLCPAKAGAPRSVLALGAELKTTLCLTQADRHDAVEALVSPHIGNLHGAGTRSAMSELVQNWLVQRHTEPEALACDLHPDFFSTRLAGQLAHERGHDMRHTPATTTQPLPVIPVAHHHAHVAAVLAEHAADARSHEPVLGLALDGHGLGPDGQAWGGELLRVHGAQCERLGHLRPLLLPGGDRAAREPWRVAAAVLHQLDRGGEITARWPHQPHAAMLQSWLQTAPQPATTSMGRLFDAAAALLGLLDVQDHEADAAMRLESLASTAWPHLPPLPAAPGTRLDAPLPATLDWRPLMQDLLAHATQAGPAHAAARFHATLARDLAHWAGAHARAHSLGIVVLSGGCMANRLLDDALTQHLHAQGLEVWRAAHYPCGDGGISLGQAWVAHHTLL
ncbi:carbamoyltransferase HypF [Aquabacterium sp.]|uniref:carbamoyltransferase HypF n=1 Tax=Aquabacterium sp. TaxID=1872578 RepID=UPI0035AF9592